MGHHLCALYFSSDERRLPRVGQPEGFSQRPGLNFLIQGLVARRSFAAKNREIVIGMIKATMEGTRQNVHQREANEVGAGQIHPTNR